MFSLSLSSIYKQDVLSSGTDFLRVDGVPVRQRGGVIELLSHVFSD
jgi:hypothetical protein